MKHLKSSIKTRKNPTIFTTHLFFFLFPSKSYLNFYREGKGIYDFPNGSSYEGEWKNDFR